MGPTVHSGIWNGLLQYGGGEMIKHEYEIWSRIGFREALS